MFKHTKRDRALLIKSALTAFIASALLVQESPAQDWGRQSIRHTSLSATELLADGQSFDGWNIQVRGFFSIGTEHIALFASREAYEYFDGTSAFFIRSFSSDIFTEELLRTLDGKRLLIQGVYRDSRREQISTPEGTLDVLTFGLGYAGSIEDINFIRLLSE